MSERTYCIENAKSGRSTCKKCKEKIGMGELRVGSEGSMPNQEYSTCVWYHVPCFPIPRKYAKAGPDHMTVEEFCRQILEDRSGDGVIRKNLTEVVETLGSRSGKAAAGAATKRKKAGEESDEDSDAGDGSLLHEIKAKFEALNSEEEGEPSSKKSQKGGKYSKSHKGEEDVVAKQVEAYRMYHKSTNADLKDVLTWNKQYKTGTKDFLLLKCIDGFAFGRLARCSLCSGQLKLLEDGVTVKCNGSFDEDLRVRIDCAFNCPAKEAPRYQPWYNRPPTEEEVEEMERIIAEAKGEEVESGDSDPDVKKLVKAAVKKFDTWNIATKAGINAATMGLIEIFRAHPGKKVDIPDEDGAAKKAVGPTLAANKDKSAAEMVPIIVKAFGFVEDKKEKAAKKQSAIESSVNNEANAALVGAFSELAQLYFKEGNANAGASYSKVAAALAKVNFAITEDNAIGLSKKPNKIEGIGKSSSDKMLEFLTTGTMEKLEEKRALYK